MRFELTERCRSAVFKTASINHSPTLPKIDASFVPTGRSLVKAIAVLNRVTLTRGDYIQSIFGARCRDRTYDLDVMSVLLYR